MTSILEKILKLIPAEPDEIGLCSEVNPTLYYFWCEAKHRPHVPSFVWTEADVVQSCDEMIEQLWDQPPTLGANHD